MFLESSDPDGYAVIHAGRVYPVRGGVFLIDPDLRGELGSFREAGEVPGEVAQELAELGSWPVPDLEPADAAAAAEVVGEREPEAEVEAEQSDDVEAAVEDAEPAAEQAEPEDEAEEQAPAEEKPEPKPRRTRAKKES